MPVESPSKCSFCGAEQNSHTPLIAGQDGYICEACVQCAHRVVSAWGSRRGSSNHQDAVPSPKEIKAQLDEYIIGQDVAKRILAVAVYNHFQRLEARVRREGSRIEHQARDTKSSGDKPVELEKSNVLLFGPTGSGKTLLAKKLAALVGVPFAVADATTLTQAGYVGDDVDTIIHRLVDAADGDAARAEWGIVYIDEIDKIARRSQGSSGVRDISGEGVQQALLKLVEGHRVTISKGKGKERTEGKDYVDTSNILFIAGGAFDGLMETVARRMQPEKRMGFGGDIVHRLKDADLAEFLEHVENRDFRSFGFIPEFLGRFPILAGLEELDEAALIRILREPKNALTRQFQVLFAQSGATLDFTPKGLERVARLALDSKTGARGLRAVFERALLSTMFELPFAAPTHCLFDVNDAGDLRIQCEELTGVGLRNDSRVAVGQLG